MAEFIPLVKNATDALSYKKTMMLFSGSIEDTHSRIEPVNYKEIFGNYGAPFTYQIAENKIVVTKPVDVEICKAIGIEYGDVIETVNGESIDRIIQRNSKYISASNTSVKIRDSYNYMFYGEKGSFTIKGYDKNKKPFQKRLIELTEQAGYGLKMEFLTIA
ncbi:hypothetical protein H9W95_17375 [Flavobacterium lindanitolerans]|nr:hypothetical protein [Flavobacterium lindanitolerans]